MEDANSRSGSEVPSSEEDFYGTGPLHEQHMDLPAITVPQAVEKPSQARSTAPAHDAEERPVEASEAQARRSAAEEHVHVNGTINGDTHDDAGDSSSEMDVSASSRSASPELQPAEPSRAGAKRKFSDATDTLCALEQALQEDSNKKPKLSPSPAPVVVHQPSSAERMSTELWQQIFLRLSPTMLCRCLLVSKNFHACLTQTRAHPVVKKDQKKVRVLDSNAIWTEARKTYFPNMPRPLGDRTELSMLQLIGGKTCQFCNRPPIPVPANTPFNAGPGPDGMRVIWPFGIRTCGQCWERNTLKDVEILVSPAAALRFGLAYAFRTPDFHFVPEIQRQQPGGIPSHLRVAKVYYKPNVQEILEEHEDIQGFGDGAANEWQKGLADKGKLKMADAARWERWEQQVRYGADLTRVLKEYDLPSFPRYLEGVQGKSAGVSSTQLHALTNGTHTLPQPVHGYLPNAYGAPFQPPHPHFQQLARPVRNQHEVEETRAARKTDIERRCMELEPPLEPAVLQHIESFQAAMQIPTLMNDAQWEVLRPRLLAQREPAELLEHRRASQLAALQAAIPSTIPDETFLKPAKEVYDREYEQAQEPLRKRLGEYADELINSQWHGGQGLDRDSVPSFAIQVLLHVRKRYLEDKAVGTLRKTDTTNGTTAKQGTPAPDPFLSLDNMKWVYDNKVRTYTDLHRRELFICAGCAEERKPKWFAFEGLIQHYGAKHTTAFSKGNIIVHWQTAEWPSDPLFHTDPAPWIIDHRKVSDYKAHERAQRRTPHQRGQDGPFMPPSPGTLLSESPLFSPSAQQHPGGGSSGLYNAQPGYPGHPQHRNGPYGPQRSLSYPAQAPLQPGVDMSPDAQLSKLSTDAREVWDSLEGVKDLMECIRIQTVLHHVVARFAEHFHMKPTLDLLTDALATNVLMRPMKNAHGLACKMCVAGQTDGSAAYQSYYARIRNVKLWNASSLISHFKIMHEPHEGTAGLDWVRDMIELLETQLVGEVIRTPGMDDDKLALIAAAFPQAFPYPLPKIGLVTEAPPDVGPDSGLANRLLDRLTKKQPQGKKRKGQHANGPSLNGREGSQDLPEPGEDEYDPRKPMYAQKGEDPMAKFDSDVARKATAPILTASGAPSFSLAPETLAALSSLTGLTAQPQQVSMPERSPSVGRAEPVSAHAAHGGANGTATHPPDISAILASLTGHLQPAQSATLPSTIDNRAGSAARPTHGHPYSHVQESPAAYHPESRRSSDRYAPEATYRTSASPVVHDAHDVQAALLRNARQYEQNQQVQPGYAEAPTYTQAQRSPPRYRYVYEEQQPPYSHSPPHTSVYREAPIQYIQLPEQHHQHQLPHAQYGYERPAPPKPIYVDEYGRPLELIPIDSAPAPVQYAPHPYEQQQQQQQQYARRAEPAPLAYDQASPVGLQYQPAYAAGGDGRQVYYEPASPATTMPGGYAPRYVVYEDGARSFVPRG